MREKTSNKSSNYNFVHQRVSEILACDPSLTSRVLISALGFSEFPVRAQQNGYGTGRRARCHRPILEFWILCLHTGLVRTTIGSSLGLPLRRSRMGLWHPILLSVNWNLANPSPEIESLAWNHRPRSLAWSSKRSNGKIHSTPKITNHFTCYIMVISVSSRESNTTA